MLEAARNSDSIIHAYQYFGGLGSGTGLWRTPSGDFETRSPITLEDASSEKALGADMMVRVDGVWDKPSVDWDDDVSGHGTNGKGNNAPRGGNHSFADGSGQWITYEDTYELHTWFLGSREAYWFQNDLPDPSLESTNPID